jgi:hypothetical protein
MMHLLTCTDYTVHFTVMDKCRKRRVKVKLSLRFKHHATKIAPCILNLGTRWRWVVSFTILPLYPQGKSPGIHGIGGWVGPRASVDAVAKRRIPSFPRRELNPGRPACNLVTILTQLSCLLWSNYSTANRQGELVIRRLHRLFYAWRWECTYKSEHPSMHWVSSRSLGFHWTNWATRMQVYCY